MAKSAAERKAAQRARQASAGMKKIEVELDDQELEMLARNCAARRPGREPYDMAEYVALLIRQDDARARSLFKSMSKQKCSRCGDSLPVKDCPLREEESCWARLGWHKTKLIISA